MSEREAEQNVFDEVARHCITQGVAAVDGHGNCVIENAAGQTCVVGHLLKVHACEVTVDGEFLYDLREILAPRLGVSPLFLYELQYGHDHYLLKSVRAYAERMVKTAEDYGLSVAVLDELAGAPNA